MPEKGAAQWTIRITDERLAQMERIRRLVRDRHGERQNGILTTAQIIDWALECFEKEAAKTGEITP